MHERTKPKNLRTASACSDGGRTATDLAFISTVRFRLQGLAFGVLNKASFF
jgi:hypothetical protein